MSASVEFNATPTTIVADGQTPEFKIPTGDHIRGGFEGLVGTIGAAGVWDGATATLQIKIAGAWHNTALVLSAATTAIIIGPNEAPRATAFRFNVAGGGASLAISIHIASRTDLVLV